MKRYIALASLALLLLACAQPPAATRPEIKLTANQVEAMEHLFARSYSVERVRRMGSLRAAARGFPQVSQLVSMQGRTAAFTIDMIDPLYGVVSSWYVDRAQQQLCHGQQCLRASAKNIRRLFAIEMTLDELMAFMLGGFPLPALAVASTPDGQVVTQDGQWAFSIDEATKEVTRITKYRIGKRGGALYTVRFEDFRTASAIPFAITIFRDQQEQHEVLRLRYETIDDTP